MDYERLLRTVRDVPAVQDAMQQLRKVVLEQHARQLIRAAQDRVKAAALECLGEIDKLPDERIRVRMAASLSSAMVRDADDFVELVNRKSDAHSVELHRRGWKSQRAQASASATATAAAAAKPTPESEPPSPAAPARARARATVAPVLLEAVDEVLAAAQRQSEPDVINLESESETETESGAGQQKAEQQQAQEQEQEQEQDDDDDDATLSDSSDAAGAAQRRQRPPTKIPVLMHASERADVYETARQTGYGGVAKRVEPSSDLLTISVGPFDATPHLAWLQRIADAYPHYRDTIARMTTQFKMRFPDARVGQTMVPGSRRACSGPLARCVFCLHEVHVPARSAREQYCLTHVEDRAKESLRAGKTINHRYHATCAAFLIRCCADECFCRAYGTGMRRCCFRFS